VVIPIGDLLDQPGDLAVHAFGLGVLRGAHPLQVTQAQDIQIFGLGLQALDFFVLYVGGVGEAHRTPPLRDAGEIKR